MNFNEVKEKVTSFQKGSIHKINYTKELKTPKKCTDVITKKTEALAKFGVRYDHLKSVRNGRNKGDLPNLNAGLPLGTEWLEYPYFIKATKSGNIQLRVTKGGLAKSTYYKNGQEITRDEAKALCLKSEFPDYKDDKVPSPIFNIGIDKITKIE